MSVLKNRRADTDAEAANRQPWRKQPDYPDPRVPQGPPNDEVLAAESPRPGDPGNVTAEQMQKGQGQPQNAEEADKQTRKQHPPPEQKDKDKNKTAK